MLDSISLTVDQEARELVQRQKHDPEALFAEHFDAVFRYFSRRVYSPEDAQDLTAETFAATVGAKPPRNMEPLSWLYGIARRKLADSLRKSRRKALSEPIQPTQTDRSRDVRNLVEALPANQREALLLQVLEELSIAQVAAVMGRSPGSVKALIQRAKERIRKESRIEQKWEDRL